MQHATFSRRGAAALIAPAALLLPTFALGQHPGLELELVSLHATAYAANFVQVKGTRAYVTSTSGGSGDLEIFDVSNPAQPIRLSSLAIFRAPVDVHVTGNRAYLCDVAASPSLPSIYYELDVTNPQAPNVVGTSPINGNARASWANSSVAFLAAMDGGVQSFLVPGLFYVGETDTLHTAIDIEVQGDYAFVCEYVLGNYFSGTLTAIDVSDPSAPFFASRAKTFGTNPLSVALQKQNSSSPGQRVHAYVADVTGLQVFDITVPTAIERDGRINLPGQASRVASVAHYYGGYGMRELCFVALGSAGIAIVDTTDPDAPALITSAATDGYAQGIAADQNYVYVADNNRGLAIYRYVQLPE